MTKWNGGSGRMRQNALTVALPIVFVIYTFLNAHLGFSSNLRGGIFSSAMTEQRVSETPWQVRRHKDSLLLIIDGNKLHSLDVWQGDTW